MPCSKGTGLGWPIVLLTGSHSSSGCREEPSTWRCGPTLSWKNEWTRQILHALGWSSIDAHTLERRKKKVGNGLQTRSGPVTGEVPPGKNPVWSGVRWALLPENPVRCGVRYGHPQKKPVRCRHRWAPPVDRERRPGPYPGLHMLGRAEIIRCHLRYNT